MLGSGNRKTAATAAERFVADSQMRLFLFSLPVFPCAAAMCSLAPCTVLQYSALSVLGLSWPDVCFVCSCWCWCWCAFVREVSLVSLGCS